MPVTPTEPDPQDQEHRTASAWGVALGAGTELVVSVLAGFFVGQWLDGKFGTGPWLMLLGAMLGITVGLYQLIRLSSRSGGPDGPPSRRR